MNSNLHKMVGNARVKNISEFRKCFSKEMQSRVFRAIDEKKIEIAKNIINVTEDVKEQQLSEQSLDEDEESSQSPLHEARAKFTVTSGSVPIALQKGKFVPPGEYTIIETLKGRPDLVTIQNTQNSRIPAMVVYMKDIRTLVHRKNYAQAMKEAAEVLDESKNGSIVARFDDKDDAQQFSKTLDKLELATSIGKVTRTKDRQYEVIVKGVKRNKTKEVRSIVDDHDGDLMESTNLQEKAPPCEKCEKFIQDNKENFKKRYKDRWEEVLYATAWQMYNKNKKKNEEIVAQTLELIEEAISGNETLIANRNPLSEQDAIALQNMLHNMNMDQKARFCREMHGTRKEFMQIVDFAHNYQKNETT